MAKAITRKESLPDYALGFVLREIEEFGYKDDWRFFETRRLAPASKRVQVRDTAHLALPEEIRDYARQMKEGVRFPPIVMTMDEYIIDGNTRTEAAQSNHETAYPAFVLNVRYSDAPPAVQHNLAQLGAALNKANGRRMSKRNISALIAQTTTDLDSPAEVARKLHVSPQVAGAAMRAKRAAERAASLGVDVDDSFNQSQLKFFGAKSSKYTGPVFREFFQLAQDARMPVPSLRALGKLVEAAESEEDKLAVLKQERASLAPMIRDGGRRPSASARVRQGLGFVLGVKNLGDVVETASGVRGPYLDSLKEARRRLDGIIELQEKVNSPGQDDE